MTINSLGIPLERIPIDVGGMELQIFAVENEDALVEAMGDLEYLPYGYLIWESSVGLARYLASMAVELAGKTVLELGCGVGLPGIVACRAGAQVSQTDHLPGVLSIARMNGEQNGAEHALHFLADWRSWTVTEKFDVIIGADILYDREMHHHVETILRNNLAPQGKVVISDPGRAQAMEFMSRFEKRGWSVSMHTEPVSLPRTTAPGGKIDVGVMVCTRE